MSEKHKIVIMQNFTELMTVSLSVCLSICLTVCLYVIVFVGEAQDFYQAEFYWTYDGKFVCLSVICYFLDLTSNYHVL